MKGCVDRRRETVISKLQKGNILIVDALLGQWTSCGWLTVDQRSVAFKDANLTYWAIRLVVAICLHPPKYVTI